MNPDVGSDGIKAEVVNQFDRVGHGFFHGQNGLSPYNRIEVQARQSGGNGPGTKRVQRAARGFHRAEAGQQIAQVVKREIGFAVNAPVVRAGEIIPDDVIADIGKGFRRDAAGIKDLVSVAAMERLDVQPVMVRPHKGELEPFMVGRLQKSTVNRTIQKWTVVVVIPVEEEGADAVVGGSVDFIGHDRRISFVLVAPQGHVRLEVSGKSRLGIPDQFPFRPVRALGLHVARVAGMVIAKVITDHGDGTGGGGGIGGVGSKKSGGGSGGSQQHHG